MGGNGLISVTDVFEWILKYGVNMSDDEIGTEELQTLIKPLNEIIALQEWKNLDIIFCFHPRFINTISIVTMLRTTFPVREKFRNWDAFCQRSYGVLRNRPNVDVDKIMKGLI